MYINLEIICCVGWLLDKKQFRYNIILIFYSLAYIYIYIYIFPLFYNKSFFLFFWDLDLLFHTFYYWAWSAWSSFCFCFCFLGFILGVLSSVLIWPRMIQISSNNISLSKIISIPHELSSWAELFPQPDMIFIKIRVRRKCSIPSTMDCLGEKSWAPDMSFEGPSQALMGKAFHIE